MADIQPMELLKADMENDEVSVRVNTIHQVKTIATVLGPEKVKYELLPYLEQLMKKEVDEVLYAIAQEMENLAPVLGNFTTILLPYLEHLAGQDETEVRLAAVQSLISISTNLQDNEIVNQFVPMIIRLANNEQNFTCRVSAVNLMCAIYPRAGTTKEKIRTKFGELCGEETPMVRRAVAKNIGQLAQVIEKDHVLSDLIQNVKQLIQDEQDQVRVLGLNSLKQIAKVLTQAENKSHTLPIIISATEDKSWRVRLSLSKTFAELAEAFGHDVTDLNLIQIFTTLLRDAENDVRQASVASLAKFVKVISPERLILILPHLPQLCKDSVPQVRVGAAEVIAEMSKLLAKDQAQQRLLPHITEMFGDENKDVRMTIARTAARFIEAVGGDGLNTFLPLFKKSIDDDKWRVRLEGYEALIILAKNFDGDKFGNYIEPLFMNYLKDKASAVRECGVEKLPILIKIYKESWVQSRLLPRLQEVLNKDQFTYLIRIIGVLSLKQVALNVSPQFAQEKVLPHLYKALSDSVPNVRFVIINSLKEIFESKKIDTPQFKNELKYDQDKDVKTFSTELLSKL